ncbi:DUF2975 domain-containing protein [Carboxylicivirga sp. RSCT41]|uniref:DUF2975 domain-containing protein n=1 Tax=Carboxylicivirga agarovorans TaxID=3417570 RepID=UPI003D3370F0
MENRMRLLLFIDNLLVTLLSLNDNCKGMMNRKIVFSVLKQVSNWGFWLCFLFLILAVVFEIFSKDGSIGSISMGTHHSKGYSLPVKVNINYPDSVFVYNRANHSSTVSYHYGSNQEFADSLRRQALVDYGSALTSSTYNRLKQRFVLKEDNDVTLICRSFSRLDGYIVANSDNWMVKAMLIIYTYIHLILLVLVFYHLAGLFAILSKQLSFNGEIYREVNKISYLLIFYVLLKLVISVAMALFGWYIRFESYTNGIPNILPMNIDIRARIDFEFTLFIVGLSLWGLSALLKRGNFIELENNLTI